MTSGLEPGGKERQLIELVKNIKRVQFSCGIIVFNHHQHYSEQALEYSHYYRELNKRPTRLEPLFNIWKCFREYKPDIVHTWDTLSSFFAYLPCKFYNIPMIDGSIRDAGIDKGWHFYFKRFFLKRADVILGNSFAGLRAYKVSGKVIYNAINTARFLPQVQGDEFNMIMTANFSDYKDHETFLKAAVCLVEDHTIDQVYLLGEGPHRKKYMDWINNLYPQFKKHFHFPGAARNVEEFLAKCRIGVLCSTPKYSEGLSNSVLEYMSAGLIPIVTDLGGSSEIVEDGKNGYLIQPKDDHKIIELVHLVKKNHGLRLQLIEQAKSTIEEKFTLQKNLETLTNLYLTLNKSTSTK